MLPLKFHGKTKVGIEQLLVEFLSVSYLVEDMPNNFDTLDLARETLRRVQSWMEIQSSGKVK